MNHLFLAGLFCLLVLTTGCTTFHRDWRKAAADPLPTDDLYGQWEGKWMSEVNGHNGRLRCLVTKEGQEKYQARFHAKYRRILSFGYTVPLTVSEGGGVFKFEGDADLGRLAGGKYHYEGRASPTNYFSTYRSKYDHGTFQMTRPR